MLFPLDVRPPAEVRPVLEAAPLEAEALGSAEAGARYRQWLPAGAWTLLIVAAVSVLGARFPTADGGATVFAVAGRSTAFPDVGPSHPSEAKSVGATPERSPPANAAAPASSRPPTSDSPPSSSGPLDSSSRATSPAGVSAPAALSATGDTGPNQPPPSTARPTVGANPVRPAAIPSASVASTPTTTVTSQAIAPTTTEPTTNDSTASATTTTSITVTPSTVDSPTASVTVTPTTAPTSTTSTAPTSPTSTAPTSTTSTAPTSTTSGTSGSGRLIWFDEFDSLDTGQWAVEHSTYGDGNGELQCYRPENVSVAGGRLVLRAVTETYTCPNGSTRSVTSGMVRSRGLTFRPGQALEFRVKLTPADETDQAGLWPAVWASGWGGGGWPAGGELDFLEVMTANDPKRSIFSMHYAKADGSHGVTNKPTFGSRNFSADWHVVRFEYGRNGRLVWYLDGRQVLVVTAADTLQGYPRPFDLPITELKLNLALGGRPGPLSPNAVGSTGARFEVDFVRLYEL